jgi:hypothetical protein
MFTIELDIETSVLHRKMKCWTFKQMTIWGGNNSNAIWAVKLYPKDWCVVKGNGNVLEKFRVCSVKLLKEVILKWCTKVIYFLEILREEYQSVSSNHSTMLSPISKRSAVQAMPWGYVTKVPESQSKNII